MKGIILAGGSGTRLYPCTITVSKQLLPIYDKPMIYYPLSILLLAGISDILIISTSGAIEQYRELLGGGERLGVKFTYIVQEKPNGLAEAFVLGEEFIGKDSVCLILGDNVFYGANFTEIFSEIKDSGLTATIFGYQVNNPKEFGVVEFDNNGKVVSLEEKPSQPKSKYAVPGLYFYNNDVVQIAKKIKPSARGEKEITDINNEYLRRGELNVKILGRGVAWLDTGTPGNLLKAGMFVETVQSRQGLYVACVEEIAWRQGFIDDAQLRQIGEKLKKTAYGKYILSLLEDGGKK